MLSSHDNSTVYLWRIVLHGRMAVQCFQFWHGTCPVCVHFWEKFCCAVATVIRLLCGDFSSLYTFRWFHPLSEFDQTKRSCRRRLSDHNARRRKPQPDAFSFAPARLPSSLIFDDRRQISFVWNKAPLSHVRPFAISPWDSPSDFKLSQVKEIREVSVNGQVLDKSCLPDAGPTLSHEIDGLLPMKGPVTSLTASKLGGAPDLQRSLSLLSASSCGLPDPVQQPSCLVQFTGATQNNRGLPPSHGGSSAPASFAEGYQPMAPSSQLVRFTLDGNSNGYDSTFFGLNRMN